MIFPVPVVPSEIRHGHDDKCRGCLRMTPRNRRLPVWANIGICTRHGSTHASGSYLHFVNNKPYCGQCADIVAGMNAEAFAAAII